MGLTNMVVWWAIAAPTGTQVAWVPLFAPPLPMPLWPQETISQVGIKPWPANLRCEVRAGICLQGLTAVGKKDQGLPFSACLWTSAVPEMCVPAETAVVISTLTGSV